MDWITWGWGFCGGWLFCAVIDLIIRYKKKKRNKERIIDITRLDSRKDYAKT